MRHGGYADDVRFHRQQLIERLLKAQSLKFRIYYFRIFSPTKEIRRNVTQTAVGMVGGVMPFSNLHRGRIDQYGFHAFPFGDGAAFAGT